MKIEDFHTASLEQIAIATGIDRTRWCRYISGKRAMMSTTLDVAAKRLDVSPEVLLAAIRKRRNSLRKQAS